MKLCKICNQEKPYNPHSTKPKERGFIGLTCYHCFASQQRMRARGLLPNDPACIELSAKLDALKTISKHQNQAIAQAREARRAAKRTPEAIEQARAKLQAAFEDKEAKYLAWQAKQHAKNAKLLATQTKTRY